MRADTVIFLLSLCIVLLVLIVIYQRFCFRTGIQAKLKEISKKLECILDTNSDEEIMVFTDDRPAGIGGADQQAVREPPEGEGRLQTLPDCF